MASLGDRRRLRAPNRLNPHGPVYCALLPAPISMDASSTICEMAIIEPAATAPACIAGTNYPYGGRIYPLGYGRAARR